MQEMNGEVNIEGLSVRQVGMPRIRFMGAPVNDQDRKRAAELTSVASGFADKVCLNLDRLESFVLANHFWTRRSKRYGPFSRGSGLTPDEGGGLP
jgi:hypothetical protein